MYYSNNRRKYLDTEALFDLSGALIFMNDKKISALSWSVVRLSSTNFRITMNPIILPNCKAIFLGFFKLGLLGFGGVLPLARYMIVEEKKWISADEFTNLLGICQILPGGNIINMSLAIGLQFQGIKGAISAIIGLFFAPTVIVVLIYQFYLQFQNIIWVQHFILGLAASAAGLLIATGLKMLKPIIRNDLTIITLALTFILIVGGKLPLLVTLLLLLTVNLCIIRMKKNQYGID